MAQKEAAPAAPAEEMSIQDLLGDLTWDQITSDGIITLDEIEDALVAKGLDPDEYDHLYE